MHVVSGATKETNDINENITCEINVKIFGIYDWIVDDIVSVSKRERIC